MNPCSGLFFNGLTILIRYQGKQFAPLPESDTAQRAQSPMAKLIETFDEQRGKLMERPYRRTPRGSTRRDFLRGAGALGLTLAAAGGARGQSASVVVINEDGSVVVPATGAATWISDSLSPGAVSSLDTGRIGYITAWGGNEYGYAYTYALRGQPTGLSIDADSSRSATARA